jgi:homoserine O-acetyltransferase/O-succinyltransferase
MELIPTALVLSLCAFSSSQELPKAVEVDYVAHDFHFRSGEVLPELHLHYRTLGRPASDANGHITNAVMMVHGTT